MLIVRGVNVFPSEIEAVVLEDPALAGQYAIVDRPPGNAPAARGACGARRRGRPGPCARRARAAARRQAARPREVSHRPARLDPAPGDGKARRVFGTGRARPIRSVPTSPPRALPAGNRRPRRPAACRADLLRARRRHALHGGRREAEANAPAEAAGEHRGQPACRGVDRPLRGRLVEALVGAAAREGADRGIRGRRAAAREVPAVRASGARRGR